MSQKNAPFCVSVVKRLHGGTWETQQRAETRRQLGVDTVKVVTGSTSAQSHAPLSEKIKHWDQERISNQAKERREKEMWFFVCFLWLNLNNKQASDRSHIFIWKWRCVYEWISTSYWVCSPVCFAKLSIFCLLFYFSSVNYQRVPTSSFLRLKSF